MAVIGENCNFSFAKYILDHCANHSLWLNASKKSSVDVNSFNPPLPLLTKILLIAFYTGAIALAFVGNLITILVFSFGRRSRTDLRGFLISLAVSNLLVGCFCLPFTFTQIYLGTWPFTPHLCPVVLFLQLLAVTSSVFTNTAIGLDRFWVVTFPMRSRLTRTRSKIVLIGVWLSSSALSTVQFSVGKLNKNDQCIENWQHGFQRRAYTIVIVMLTYVLPLTILMVTYSIVGIKLWRRSVPGNADEHRDYQQLQSKKKIIKMLVMIVTLFGVCWLPLHVFFLIDDYGNLWNNLPGVMVHLIFCFSHWLAMANSFVNPFIYGFMNDSFKVDLRTLMSQGYSCIIRRNRSSFSGSAHFNRDITFGVGTDRKLNYTSVPLRYTSSKSHNLNQFSCAPVKQPLGKKEMLNNCNRPKMSIPRQSLENGVAIDLLKMHGVELMEDVERSDSSRWRNHAHCGSNGEMPQTGSGMQLNAAVNSFPSSHRLDDEEKVATNNVGTKSMEIHRVEQLITQI